MVTESTDLALAAAFTGDGNEKAFAALYQRHVDRTYRLVARILGPSGDVDDCVQEIFVQVHRSLERFRADCQFTTWLHRIAVNVANSALRQRLRDRRDSVEHVPEADPTDRMEAREAVHALYQTLDELPEHNRTAFILFEIEGLSLEQIAETTAVPLQAAAARLRRARVAIADALSRPSERRKSSANFKLGKQEES